MIFEALAYGVVVATAAFGGVLPDSTKTPGVVDPSVTVKDVCTPGFAKKRRNVDTQTKKEVCKNYGNVCKHGKQEIDHLVSLELGGTNDPTNLWPEPYEPRPGAHEKDQLENRLHSCVCSGKTKLSDAQEMISSNWLKYYQQLAKRKCPIYNAK